MLTSPSLNCAGEDGDTELDAAVRFAFNCGAEQAVREIIAATATLAKAARVRGRMVKGNVIPILADGAPDWVAPSACDEITPPILAILASMGNCTF
jgi:hypothetical protein